MAEKRSLYPATGKISDTTVHADMHKAGSGGFHGSRISTPRDRRSFVSSPMYVNLPSFTVETIHISCKSDAFRGNNYCYGGIIIYSCDGKSQWQTANGTRCKSGYLVIMDTDTEKVKMFQQGSPGQVHGAVYRSAFGEECTDRKVNAEGFSVMGGVFKINSGVFNPAKDGYHDDKRSMHPVSARCIERVVKYWMDAGKHFYRCRNFKVKDLNRASLLAGWTEDPVFRTVLPVATRVNPVLAPPLAAVTAALTAAVVETSKDMDGCKIQ